MTIFIMPYDRYVEYVDKIADNVDEIDPVLLYVSDGGMQMTTRKNELRLKSKKPSEAVVLQTENPEAFKKVVPLLADFKVNYMQVSEKQFDHLTEGVVKKINKDLENLGLVD